jgi:hypothetical protein
VARKSNRAGAVLLGALTLVLAACSVVAAFRAVGWTWGGSWTSPRDYMHFSSTGR